MTILGPVDAAKHSQPTVGGGIFSFAVGAFVVLYVWARYLRMSADEAKPPISNLLWVTLVGCVFIGFGAWELIKRLLGSI